MYRACCGIRTGLGPAADGGRRVTTAGRDQSRALNERLHAVIPGGAHTYAKGDDQYPEGMAPVIERGEGAHVWDVDGNRYVEYGSGLRAVSLGHAHPRRERGRSGGDGPWHQLHPASADRAGGRGGAPRAACPGPTWSSSRRTARTPPPRRSSSPARRPGATSWRSAATSRSSPPTTGSSGTTAMPAGMPPRGGRSTVTFRYNDLDSLGRPCSSIIPAESPASSSRPPPRSSRGQASSRVSGHCATSTGPSSSSTR